jgi:reactive intermediate/imine deaminase
MRLVRSLAMLLCTLVAAAELSAQAPSGKQVFTAPNARPSVLSPAVRVGDLVYLSGALGSKPGGGGMADGGIQGQTRQALENVKASLALAGGMMEDIVKCSVFLTDVKDFGAMNEVYREFFPKDPPARTTVAVAGLVAPGALIEIECIAAARK